jgi:hypothetical protein
VTEYDALLVELQGRMRACKKARDYQKGRTLKQVLTHVKLERENQRKDDLQRAALDEYELDQSLVMGKLRDFDTETTEKLRKLKERLGEERRSLQEDQRNEFDEHDMRWTSPSKERQYRTASVNLLEHRRQLDLMLERSQFAEAEQVASIIERLEMDEGEGMIALRQHHYDETVKLLTAKHKSELDRFDKRGEVQIAQFLQQRQRERLTIENRQKKVDKEGQVANNKERIWAMERGRLAVNLSRDVRLSRESSKASDCPCPLISRVGKEAELSVLAETTISLPPLVKAKRPKRLYPVP